MKKSIAGEIPIDWEALLIKRFASVVRGGSPRPAGSPMYFNGDYIPWITVADVTCDNGIFLTKTNSMLTEEGSKKTRIIEPGTLLLTNSGATLGVPKISLIRAGANDGIAMILEPKGVTNIYLYHFLSSKTQFLRKQAAPGNGQPNLNTDIIGTIPVPIPPPTEQLAIADLLSTWNQAIEKIERMIVVKEKKFKGLTQKLLKKNTGEWVQYHIRDICKPVTRKNDINELNVLTTSAQHGLVSQLDYYKKSVSADDVSGYYLLNKGEFAYNRSSSNGYPYGAIKRLETSPQGVLSTLYLCFSIKDSKLYNSDFLSHSFESGVLNKQLAEVCREGARSHGLLNITKSEFFGLKIFLPTIEEQHNITETLNTARQEIDLLKKQAEAFRKQKRGLMQKLLTGQWRVKTELEEVV